ncbi:MAG: YraN family protein [Fimbriiglobus sp.]
MATPARTLVPPHEDGPGFGRWSFWKRWFGQRSERAAAKFLRKLGYRIIAQNVHLKRGELDLIAADRNTIVIVEVRSTSGSDPQVPADSVNFAKQQKLVRAALEYLQRHGLLGQNVRFDVLAIAWPEGEAPKFLHLPHAFEPTDRHQMWT